MSVHDSWVTLNPGSIYDRLIDLFPEGIPVRDPFPMESVREPDGTRIIIYTIDLARLSEDQFDAIADAIADKHGIFPDEIKKDAIATGGFGLQCGLIDKLTSGAEGWQRTKELTDFLDTNPQPSVEAMDYFFDDQRRRWIDGNEIPPPLPTSIAEIDPRLYTPELERAIEQNRIEAAIAQKNYSVFDVLTGKATSDILNELDPEAEWSVYSEDDFDDEEENLDDLPDLGACCACECQSTFDNPVRNLLMLHYKTPLPGTGWGNVEKGLPFDGADAVVCDRCLETNVPLKFYIYGFPEDKQRRAIVELTEPFGDAESG